MEDEPVSDAPQQLEPTSLIPVPDLDADRRPVEAEGEPVLETLISQAEADRIGSRIAFVNAEREADLEETERRLEQLSISPWRTTMMRNYRLLKNMRQP